MIDVAACICRVQNVLHFICVALLWAGLQISGSQWMLAQLMVGKGGMKPMQSTMAVPP